ncbi:hypothetical protein PHLCEN_2v13611 [Hermanssonia centrifuga]|uniref:DUF6534 domain-containing protein n=1 Tax=Hermanssonia centrifuga TaxID=98765 RepID=A0A2R6NDM4_9APHY|nr:hypothetical protein PHLCEN_2v13611 [Hermanssonia centrifuga]
MPDNFIFMACYFVLSKLYVNSFLATLNTRRVLRGRGTDAETNTMPTFLMVGKLTKHNPNQFADHVYPPSSAPGSKLDINHSQQYTSATALEVGVDREVTVTTDSTHPTYPPTTEVNYQEHPFALVGITDPTFTPTHGLK